MMGELLKNFFWVQPTIATWFAYAFVLFWLVQMCYYIFVFMRIGRRVKPKEYQPIVPVSVVICAKNESENLIERLKFVLEQDYPEFEVIVVNDSSTDDTIMVLNEFKKFYKNLYVTEIERDKRFGHGKKLALTIGIKAAKYEWLLLTDADCKPESKYWIRTMAQNFTDDTDFVLGYGGYEEKRGLFNKLLRYDAGFIALQYFTYAEVGMPYMGVGRNLAYRKSLFFRTKGFASHSRLMSGDDDIFVNDNAVKNKVKLEYNPHGFTSCVPQENFSKWNHQKQRHFTASERYKTSHKLVLGLEQLSRTLFYLLAVILAFVWPISLGVGVLFLLRYFVFLYTITKTSKRFNIKGVSGWAILFDFVLPYINLVQLLLSKFRRDRLTWK